MYLPHLACQYLYQPKLYLYFHFTTNFSVWRHLFHKFFQFDKQRHFSTKFDTENSCNLPLLARYNDLFSSVRRGGVNCSAPPQLLSLVAPSAAFLGRYQIEQYKKRYPRKKSSLPYYLSLYSE